MGSIKNQGITNTIISYLGIIIGFVNLLILQPTMLTAEEFGLTRIIYASTILFGTLFPIGLNFMTIRYFPRFKDSKNGHNGYMGLLLLISCASYLLFALVVFIGKNYILSKYSNAPLFIEYFYYIFPISLFVGLTTLLSGYSAALFKTSFPSFLNDIYIRLCMTLLVSLYFLKLISFHWFMGLYLLSYGTQLLILFLYLLKTDGINLKINWLFFKTQNKKEIIKYTLLLALASLASIAIRNIDIMFVGSFLGLDAVAVYTIAFTIGSIIEAPVNAFSKIADSKISDALSRNDFTLIETVYFKSTKILMIIGGLLFVGVCINIHTVLSLLPDKYHGGEWVVIIIGISSFFNMATGVNTSMIYYSDKYTTGTYLLYGMIATSVILNLIFIPIMGIIGAAIATGTALLLFNVFKFLLILKHFKMQPYKSYVFVIVSFILLSLGVNYFLPVLTNPYINMLYRSVIITLIYCSGVLFFKLIPDYKKHIPFIVKK